MESNSLLAWAVRKGVFWRYQYVGDVRMVHVYLGNSLFEAIDLEEALGVAYDAESEWDLNGRDQKGDRRGADQLSPVCLVPDEREAG